VTFKKAYKSIFSASKNLCISPQRQTWWPFSEVDVDQGSNSKIQTRVAAERAVPFPVVTFYKTKPSTVRGHTWFMAAWALGIPITRSRIGEPHYATQIQILTKSCSQFLFLSLQWKKQDRELNTWWRCGQGVQLVHKSCVPASSRWFNSVLWERISWNKSRQEQPKRM